MRAGKGERRFEWEAVRAKLNEGWGDTYYQLSGKPMAFTKNKQTPVYSGPGEHYVRAAGGKASVGTNGEITVYGQESGFALISYDTNNGGVRFGYVPVSALAQGQEVAYLDSMRAGGIILEPCDVVDDPVRGKSTLRTLSKEYVVIVVAVYGDWAYIDDCYSNKNNPCRGFVPLKLVHFTIAI